MNRLQICLLSLSLISTVLNAAPLSISTWNIEWLTDTQTVNNSMPTRSSHDFEKLSTYFKKLDSDIVAFQEVDNKGVIQSVAGKDYDIYFSDRQRSHNHQHQFKDINQYTGFAVRKGIPVTDIKDVKLESSPYSKLRFASYIIVTIDKQPVHLLSVHLKAGCSGAYRSNNNCVRLKAQTKALNGWIKDREQAKQAYVVLGDFNHNLSYQGDWMWQTLRQSTTAELVTQLTKAECKVRSNRNPNKTHQFRSVIDHIVASRSLNMPPAVQLVFKTQDVLSHQLSDHCPVYTHF